MYVAGFHLTHGTLKLSIFRRLAQLEVDCEEVTMHRCFFRRGLIRCWSFHLKPWDAWACIWKAWAPTESIQQYDSVNGG